MVTFPPLPMRNSTSAWFLWGPQEKKQGYLMSKISTIMEKSVMSLVMDTIGIVGMFCIAAVLLCI